jgi:hypothetical protein
MGLALEVELVWDVGWCWRCGRVGTGLDGWCWSWANDGCGGVVGVGGGAGVGYEFSVGGSGGVGIRVVLEMR